MMIRATASIAILLKLLLFHLVPMSASTDNINIKSALQILGRSTDRLKKHSNTEENTDYYPSATIAFAQTLDGSIAPTSKERMSISSETSFKLLHSLRSCHEGILIGINTLVCDEPQLNVRQPLPNVVISQPRPIVVDTHLKVLDLPLSSIRLNNPIFCTTVSKSDPRWQLALDHIRSIGGELLSISKDSNGRCNLRECFMILARNYRIKSILIEGGASIIQSILENDLACQVVLTIKLSFLGGFKWLNRELPLLIDLDEVLANRVDGDIVVHGYLRQAIPAASRTSDETEQRARELLSQWENYASKSTEVYAKLYPVSRGHMKNATSEKT